MAARQKISVRVDPELVAWADSYAEQHGSNRSNVIEAALGSFRQDCAGGVPVVAPASSYTEIFNSPAPGPAGPPSFGGDALLAAVLGS